MASDRNEASRKRTPTTTATSARANARHLPERQDRHSMNAGTTSTHESRRRVWLRWYDVDHLLLDPATTVTRSSDSTADCRPAITSSINSFSRSIASPAAWPPTITRCRGSISDSCSASITGYENSQELSGAHPSESLVLLRRHADSGFTNVLTRDTRIFSSSYVGNLVLPVTSTCGPRLRSVATSSNAMAST